MAGDNTRNTGETRGPNALSVRILISLHSRGVDRNCSGKLLIRHRPTRYLLRCGTFPLCPFNGRGIRHLCRDHFLIFDHYRGALARYLNKGSISFNVYWRQRNLFSPTLFGVTGHAAALLRLPGFNGDVKRRKLGRQFNENRRGDSVSVNDLIGALLKGGWCRPLG